MYNTLQESNYSCKWKYTCIKQFPSRTPLAVSLYYPIFAMLIYLTIEFNKSVLVFLFLFAFWFVHFMHKPLAVCTAFIPPPAADAILDTFT